MNAKFMMCPTCGNTEKNYRVYRCPKCGGIICDRCTPYRHCARCGQEGVKASDQIGWIE